MKVAQISWTTLDIEGQEVRIMHTQAENGLDTVVTFMGTLELNGAWHDVVAEIEASAAGAKSITSFTIRNVNGDYVTERATEGGHAFVLWAAENYLKYEVAPLALTA